MSETKTKKKAGPSTKVHRKMNFGISELPGCCGIAVVNSFMIEDEYEYGYGSWEQNRRKLVKPKYETLEEQAEFCYQELVAKSYEEADYDKYTTLLVSLVTKYQNPEEEGVKAQFPELAKILDREGWDKVKTFINPNHGNEVTLWIKHFPERVQELLDENGID